MKVTKTLQVANRESWRRWLRKNSATEKEIWLISHRKHSGRRRLSYNDAVEEALCYGWIDSTVKRLDAERTAQRFSPRRPGSSYSQTNRERIRRLVRQRKVSKKVLAGLGDVIRGKYSFPRDILQALRSNTRAWKNFGRYAPSYQRIRIAYIDSARKRPPEFRKRLRHFLRMTENNRQFGNNIESYY